MLKNCLTLSTRLKIALSRSLFPPVKKPPITTRHARNVKRAPMLVVETAVEEAAEAAAEEARESSQATLTEPLSRLARPKLRQFFKPPSLAPYCYLFQCLDLYCPSAGAKKMFPQLVPKLIQGMDKNCNHDISSYMLLCIKFSF